MTWKTSCRFLRPCFQSIEEMKYVSPKCFSYFVLFNDFLVWLFSHSCERSSIVVASLFIVCTCHSLFSIPVGTVSGLDSCDFDSNLHIKLTTEILRFSYLVSICNLSDDFVTLLLELKTSNETPSENIRWHIIIPL